jgi:hypothetical protein
MTVMASAALEPRINPLIQSSPFWCLWRLQHVEAAIWCRIQGKISLWSR